MHTPSEDHRREGEREWRGSEQMLLSEERERWSEDINTSGCVG